MHIVTVLFKIAPDRIDAFLAAMRTQARTSLDREADCVQFDVCVDPDAPTRVFLYEVYRSADAFALHLASDHFKRFDETVAPWVVSKDVARFERIADV